MSDELWRDWRLTHEGLVWRVALPEDTPGMLGLFEVVEGRFGAQDRPDLFAAPVLLTLIAENDAGHIVDGLYVELVAEIVKFSDNRAAFRAYPLLLPVIGSFLQARQVRVVQMSVKTRWTRLMAPHLSAMGFYSTRERFSQWIRKVRD